MSAFSDGEICEIIKQGYNTSIIHFLIFFIGGIATFLSRDVEDSVLTGDSVDIERGMQLSGYGNNEGQKKMARPSSDENLPEGWGTYGEPGK